MLPPVRNLESEEYPGEKQNATRIGVAFFYLVEAAGIEPASASPLQAVLHA